MKTRKNNESGITLIALAITIIVMLILAGVSIRALTSNGVIGQSRTAATETKKKDYEEQINLAITDAQLAIESDDNANNIPYLVGKYLIDQNVFTEDNYKDSEERTTWTTSTTELQITTSEKYIYKVDKDGNLTFTEPE